MPNVLSPRDLVSRPDSMDETVLHTPVYKCRIMIKAVPVSIGSVSMTARVSLGFFNTCKAKPMITQGGHLRYSYRCKFNKTV